MLHAVQGWDTSVRGTISKGSFVQGAQHPRIFGQGHIGQGHINLLYSSHLPFPISYTLSLALFPSFLSCSSYCLPLFRSTFNIFSSHLLFPILSSHILFPPSFSSLPDFISYSLFPSFRPLFPFFFPILSSHLLPRCP